MQISNSNLFPPIWGSVNSVKENNSPPLNHASGAGFHAGQLDGDALTSQSIRLSRNTWITASVFKADDFSADNPVVRVVGTNADGTPFEEFININNVDPREASFIEMLALDGYNAANGKGVGKFARAAAAGMQSQDIARGGCGTNWGYGIDAFTSLDMLSPVIQLMNLQQRNGNIEGFMRLQEIVNAMNRHTLS